MSEYQQFTKDEKVINLYGQVLTVIRQQGCQVFVREGGWYHPAKLFKAVA